jgi:predicted TIM-barrel fold metal-dependent hydrolase
MSHLEYGIFDCDQHCWEPRDSFTRYLPKEYLDRTIAPVRLPNGQEAILAGNRIAAFNSEGGLGLDLAYRPGSLKQMLKQMASGNPDETYEPAPMQPEYVEREPRVKVLRAQGVERCVLYPSGMGLAAENFVKDTDALYVNLRAFNRYMDEEWGLAGADGLYATALLSLRDLELAVQLTDEILERGAKVVLVPTGPAYGRTPSHPYFDAVWSRLNEAGVTLAFHVMPNWYFDAISPAWGQDPDCGVWHASAWQWMNLYGERPAVDTLSAVLFDNFFGRFPNLRVLVSEMGASWVPHTLEHLDKSRGMGRNGPWIGGKLADRPSNIFKEFVRVAPYPEDDVPRIVAELGGDDRCLVMGSDFPHAEGVAEPAEFEAGLNPLPADAKHRIMRGNAETLFNR